MEFKHNLKLLISNNEIQEKIKVFAKEINEKYKNETLTVITIMNGAVFFFADLVKLFEMPIKMDTIVVSSYSGTNSTKELKFHKKVIKPIIEGQHVLIIEDIIDTGITMTGVYEYLHNLNPKTLDIVVLATKKENHPEFKYPYKALFEVPNKFIVGYGFEIDDLYRQLDCVYTVED